MQRISRKLSSKETVNLSNLQGLFKLRNRLGFLTVSIPLESESGTTGMLNFSVHDIISFIPNWSDILRLFCHLEKKMHSALFIICKTYASLTWEDRWADKTQIKHSLKEPHKQKQKNPNKPKPNLSKETKVVISVKKTQTNKQTH